MNKPVKPARDSDIDVLLHATRTASNAAIYHRSYLSRGTITKLREQRPGKKKTRYPTHMTMTGIAAACGLKWRLVKK